MIRKYGNDFEGLLDWIDRAWYRPSLNYTWHGQWVDPYRYDIVPKDSYKKELISLKEKEIANLKEKEKLLTEELEKLKSG
jgi:hypothetical protein